MSNTNEGRGIMRNILSVIAIILFMNATTSCSFREGNDSIMINNGSGEVTLQLPQINAGYMMCLTPVGFDVEKSQDDNDV
jgi:hypothetical protein